MIGKLDTASRTIFELKQTRKKVFVQEPLHRGQVCSVDNGARAMPAYLVSFENAP